MSTEDQSAAVQAERALLAKILGIARLYVNSPMSTEDFMTRVLDAIDEAQIVTVGVFDD